MGLFQKLFGNLIGNRVTDISDAASKIDALADRSEREMLDEMRKARPRDIKPMSIADIKAQIEAGAKDILDSVENTFRQGREADEAERRMREESRAREPWYRFVNLGIPIVRGIDFGSSNVYSVQYDIEHKSLYIEYRTGHQTDGRTYRYWVVSERLAAAAFNSASKGKFVWDNLRIRGTLLGHRLNYALIEGGQSLKWTRTAEQIRNHDEQVGVESGSDAPHPVLQLGATGSPPVIQQPYKALGKFALTSPKVT